MRGRIRRRSNSSHVLALAALSFTAADLGEEQAADNTIRRPVTQPVTYSHGTVETADGGSQRNLAITDLFQSPSQDDATDVSALKVADNDQLGDLFGRDRTSNVAAEAAAAAADEEQGAGDATDSDIAYGEYLRRPTPFIVNGIDVLPNKYPWFAAGGMKWSSFGGCAGVLIATDWILTAAHCVTKGYGGADPPGITRWRVGYMGAGCTDNCGQISVDVGYNEIVVHPEYDWLSNSIYPDMALARLNSPVTAIEPVEIDEGTYVGPGGVHTNLQGEMLTAIGVGFTQGQNQNQYFPEILQEVDVPYVPRSQCAAAYYESPDNAHWEAEICAGVQGKDSCNGDSGGPLVIQEGSGKYRLLATVSYGTADCDGTPPGVYTTVGYQFEWIKSVVCTGGVRDPSFCGPPPDSSSQSSDVPSHVPSSDPPTKSPTTSPTDAPEPATDAPSASPTKGPTSEAEDDTRIVIPPKVKALCVRESPRLYARKIRRNGLPAVKESCMDLSLRPEKNRRKICRRRKGARRRCPQTCKGQCSLISS